MTTHMTGTREEWLAARLALIDAEKELTRRSDELARRRQELPWVRIDKEYRFETDEGSASLTDKNLDVVERLIQFAEARNHTILELAFAWLLAHQQVVSVIAGATKPEQVRANAAAAGWQLSAAEVSEIDAIAPHLA